MTHRLHSAEACRFKTSLKAVIVNFTSAWNQFLFFHSAISYCLTKHMSKLATLGLRTDSALAESNAALHLDLSVSKLNWSLGEGNIGGNGSASIGQHLKVFWSTQTKPCGGPEMENEEWK